MTASPSDLIGVLNVNKAAGWTVARRRRARPPAERPTARRPRRYARPARRGRAARAARSRHAPHGASPGRSQALYRRDPARQRDHDRRRRRRGPARHRRCRRWTAPWSRLPCGSSRARSTRSRRASRPSRLADDARMPWRAAAASSSSARAASSIDRLTLIAPRARPAGARRRVRARNLRPLPRPRPRRGAGHAWSPPPSGTNAGRRPAPGAMRSRWTRSPSWASPAVLLPPDVLLAGTPAYEADPLTLAALLQGRPVPAAGMCSPHVRVRDTGGRLRLVGSADGTLLRPRISLLRDQA